ncbi:MAG: phosphate ABC transporter ATP-binding protein, partial [bacterium]|nr:phosphate ABC transporter ATP-binding protein [bacterium]
MVPKLATIDLSLAYGRVPALAEVTSVFPEGLITALIGPSGGGKTSLLRCLNRMNDHLPGVRRRGRVLLDGEDIYRRGVDPALIRRRVGMVFQRPNPFPLSVFANVAYGPRVHGITDRVRLRAIVERVLGETGLWGELRGKLDRPALDLPLGQQQLLCLARLLAVRPEVILLDEPCSALDPEATRRLEDLVRRLVPSYTVIIVTHSLAQAARLSDHTLFLLDGRLVEAGPTAQVFGAPGDRRTGDYLAGRLGA